MSIFGQYQYGVFGGLGGVLGPSASSPTGLGDLTLRGMTRGQVESLQRALNIKLAVGQQPQLLVDGIHGPKTWNALTWLLGTQWWGLANAGAVLSRVQQVSAGSAYMADWPDPVMVRGVQAKLGVSIDGAIGAGTWRAITGRYPTAQWWRRPFHDVAGEILRPNAGSVVGVVIPMGGARAFARGTPTSGAVQMIAPNVRAGRKTTVTVRSRQPSGPAPITNKVPEAGLRISSDIASVGNRRIGTILGGARRVPAVVVGADDPTLGGRNPPPGSATVITTPGARPGTPQNDAGARPGDTDVVTVDSPPGEPLRMEEDAAPGMQAGMGGGGLLLLGLAGAVVYALSRKGGRRNPSRRRRKRRNPRRRR